MHPAEDRAAPPFDTVLYNPALEITETTIANIAFRFDRDDSRPFTTPKTDCGLLQGVMRAELLERGELVEGIVTLAQVKEAAEVGHPHSFSTRRPCVQLKPRVCTQRGTLEVICFNAVRGVFAAQVQLS